MKKGDKMNRETKADCPYIDTNETLSINLTGHYTILLSTFTAWRRCNRNCRATKRTATQREIDIENH